MADDLKKGWKDMAASALAMAGVAGTAITSQPKPPAPIHQEAPPVEAPKALAPQVSTQPEAPEAPVEHEAKFDPDTLAPELVPIAHIESSFGKNMKHVAHSKGDYHTAYGALGLKPISAHDEYLHSKGLQKLFPNLKEADQFTKEFKDNPQFYNAIAGHHWNRLKKQMGGSKEKAAFAWRWGQGAASKVDEATVQNNPYVKKYKELTDSIFHKSEDENLFKMAISNIKPGKMAHDGGDHKVYNYDHVLTPKHIAKGYSLQIHDAPNRDSRAVILHNGKQVGYAISTKNPNGELKFQEAFIKDPSYRGQGIGQALYEATFAHAKNVHGLDRVRGDSHSTLASNVHKKLAEKHGLEYQAVPNYGEGADYENHKDWSSFTPGPFDAKYKPYSFKLNETSLNKAIGDLKPGKLIGKEGDEHVYDYSHLLQPDHAKNGYQMHVHDSGDNATVWLKHPSSQIEVGTLDGGFAENGAITPWTAGISEGHQGKGLGQHLYEALYAHGKHMKGATHVSGDIHSSMASRVHAKLSDKHGLDYKASPNPTAPNKPKGAFDQKYDSYQYTLKYDIFQKNAKELNMPKEYKLEHYSHVPNLTELDPKFQGTGLAKGLERARPNRPPRVYVYEAGYSESVIDTASYKYEVILEKSLNLYDLGTDVYNLLTPKLTKTETGVLYRPPDLDEVEEYLISRGFDGYKNYNVHHPNAVALFISVKCKRV